MYNFRAIIFEDFSAPSLQNDTFDLQTGWPDQSVLASGKHSKGEKIQIWIFES